jgi:hypothetical protein
MARNSKKTKEQLEEEREERESREEVKEHFRNMVFDRRRYRSFTLDELKQIIEICNMAIERRREEEIENLKAQQEQIAERLKELQNEEEE